MRRAWSPPHERQEFADRLDAILRALEIRDLAKDARLFLQKILQRADVLRSFDPKRFPEKGDGRVTLLLRTVFESSNGAAALTLPILDAVSICLRPIWVDRGLAWIEAFDRIDLVGLHATLTDLGLADQLSRALYVKLEAILGPPTVKAAAKPVKAPKKPPASIARIRQIKAKLELGEKLLALRAETPGNCNFGRLVRKQFDVDQVETTEAMRVAKVYGTRWEITTRLSWAALVEMSSPSMPESVRRMLEAKIVAGEKLGAADIRRARGRMPNGRPRESSAPMREAA